MQTEALNKQLKALEEQVSSVEQVSNLAPDWANKRDELVQSLAEEVQRRQELEQKDGQLRELFRDACGMVASEGMLDSSSALANRVILKVRAAFDSTEPSFDSTETAFDSFRQH